MKDFIENAMPLIIENYRALENQVPGALSI
jgi:hypothetical protein